MPGRELPDQARDDYPDLPFGPDEPNKVVAAIQVIGKKKAPAPACAGAGASVQQKLPTWQACS